MKNTNQVTYSKLTDHRGNKRIWLEGKRLSLIGFNRYEPYSTELDEENTMIILRLDPDGDKKVAGRKRGEREIPILDLGNEKITKMLGDAERIRAIFSEGKIVIEVHHEDKALKDREDRFKKHAKEGAITKGDACSGAAVFTAAMQEAMDESGISSSVEWIIDREGKYLQVAIDNNPAIDDDTCIFEASLEELEPELLTNIDHLHFSLACTGHSTAGKSKNKIGKAEEHPIDATSVFGIRDIIKNANPALLTSENVTEAQDSATYTLLKSELQRLGYVVYETILDQFQAGSFERRKRYWFMAISKGLDALTKGMGLDNIQPYPLQYACLGNLLEDVPADDPSWSDNQYLKDKAIRDKATGKGFANRQLLSPGASSCGTIGRHYNKRRSTEPFVTRSDGKERLLTPVEHARAKGIPEEMTKGVARTTAHEFMGQAGLWNQAKGIGDRISDIIKMVNGHGQLQS